MLQAIGASECGWLAQGGVLRPQGTALVLGFAAVLALETEVGLEAARMNAEAARRAAAQSARQQSDATAGSARQRPPARSLHPPRCLEWGVGDRRCQQL